MADRGISHQALDVTLADGGKRTEDHRGKRDENHDLLPVMGDRSKGFGDDADDERHGSHLRGGGKKCRYRGRRAFIDIRRPHVERNGRNLECQTGQNEDETEHQTEFTLTAGDSLGDFGKADVAGVTVDERNAVKQHARGKRTENEVFQTSFRRTDAIAVECCQNVERQRLQFETEIERQHVGC